MATFMNSAFGGSLRGGGMMGIELPKPPMQPVQPPQAMPAPPQAMPIQPGQQPPQAPPMQPQGAKIAPEQQQMLDKIPAMLQNAKNVNDLMQVAEVLSNSGIPQLKMVGDGLKQKIEQEKAQGKPEEAIVNEFKQSMTNNQPPSGESAKG